MNYQSKPNSWVYQDVDSKTKLSYALQINPAPFTVSIPHENPVIGSLEFVVTNDTPDSIVVTSITFPLVVGTGSDCITTTTSGIDTLVNDTVNWTVIGPPTPVTNGTANYKLQPTVGSYALPAGASVIVQIFGFPTIQTPGNSTIAIKELIASKEAYSNFILTTFPTGFYFNSLSPTVKSNGNAIPVAQVNTGSTVTLTWNASVVDVKAFVIYYSNPNSGQQIAKPSIVGEWTSPPLTCDTVFTVVVSISAQGGQPLTASMTTLVSVQNPSLVAAGITTGTASVSKNLSVAGTINGNAITATGLTISGTGTLSTPNASVSNNMSVTNGLTAANVTVAKLLKTASASVTSSLSAASATVTALTATNATVTGILKSPTLETNELNVVYIINATGGTNMSGTVNLCGKSDYSLGTVGIGGDVPQSSMLTVTNTQTTGFGVAINAPNLFPFPAGKGGWGLYVVSLCANTSGSWFRVADVNLKKDMKPYQDGLNEVLKLNPIKFHYTEESGLGSDYEHIGVSAQDLQEVAPYMVGKGKIKPDSSEEHLHMDTGPLTYMMVNAIKELKAEMDAKVKALEEEIEKLKKK